MTQAADHARGIEENSWVLVTDDREFLGRPEIAAAARTGGEGSRTPVTWTDRESSLLAVFR